MAFAVFLNLKSEIMNLKQLTKKLNKAVKSTSMFCVHDGFITIHPMASDLYILIYKVPVGWKVELGAGYLITNNTNKIIHLAKELIICQRTN